MPSVNQHIKLLFATLIMLCTTIMCATNQVCSICEVSQTNLIDFTHDDECECQDTHSMCESCIHKLYRTKPDETGYHLENKQFFLKHPACKEICKISATDQRLITRQDELAQAGNAALSYAATFITVFLTSARFIHHDPTALWRDLFFMRHAEFSVVEPVCHLLRTKVANPFSIPLSLQNSLKESRLGSNTLTQAAGWGIGFPLALLSMMPLARHTDNLMVAGLKLFGGMFATTSLSYVLGEKHSYRHPLVEGCITYGIIDCIMRNCVSLTDHQSRLATGLAIGTLAFGSTKLAIDCWNLILKNRSKTSEWSEEKNKTTYIKRTNFSTKDQLINACLLVAGLGAGAKIIGIDGINNLRSSAACYFAA